MKVCKIGIVLAIAILSGSPCSAQEAAQQYPSRRVNIVVPLSSGSVTDILSRVLADSIRPIWNQPLVVENRPGVPGTLSVVKAPADGYTLLMASNGHTVLNEINRALPFDALRDFAGVAQIASVPFVLVAASSLRVNSIQSLVDLGKKRPGLWNMALPGRGTAASIASELFLKQAGLNVTRVPYKGAPDAHIAMLGGDAHLLFSAVNIGLPMIQSGKVRALAVTTAHRLPSLPDVPTLAEAGLPNFSYDAWFGVLVRASTERSLVQKLSRDILSAADAPEFRKRLEDQGLEVVLRGPDEFDAIIRKDSERYGELFRQTSN